MPNIHGTLSSTGTLVGRLNQYGGGEPGTNNYEDLTNLPKINNVTLIGNKTLADIGIPTVNNATLTIQKNGSNVATFSANASSNATANITVPTKTSDLTNDNGYVVDANYNHTDNNFTDALATKLGGIETGAQVNVQANWSEASTASDAYIQNKPTLATVATSGDYDDLTNKPTIPEAPVQSNWNESTTSSLAYIQNKPTIPTATSDLTNDSGYQTASDVSSAIETAIAGITAVQYDTVNEQFTQASVVIAQFATDEEIINLYN